MRDAVINELTSDKQETTWELLQEHHTLKRGKKKKKKVSFHIHLLHWGYLTDKAAISSTATEEMDPLTTKIESSYIYAIFDNLKLLPSTSSQVV